MKILIKNGIKYGLVKIHSNGMYIYVSDNNKKIFVPSCEVFKNKEKYYK